MPEEELIAETNRMLHQLLEINAQQREEAKKFKEELEQRHNSSIEGRLRDMGAAPEGPDNPIDWETRRKEIQQKTQENIETARQKDEEYKAALLHELRLQSDLLKQILEKL